MEYQVWTSDYGEQYTKIECGDLGAVKREVLKAVMAGKEPLVTQSLSFNINVTVTEGPAPTKKVPKKELLKPEEKEKEVDNNGFTEGGPEGDQSPGS